MWLLSFGGVVWVGFSFVAKVPEVIPEKLEPMLMAKVDWKSAVRMVPVLRQDWELLGMKWKEAY